MAQPSLTVTSDVTEMVVDCVVDNHFASAVDTLTPSGTLIGQHDCGVNAHTGGMSDNPGAASVVSSWTGCTATNKWGQVGVSLRAAPGGAVTFMREDDGESFQIRQN